MLFPAVSLQHGVRSTRNLDLEVVDLRNSFHQAPLREALMELMSVDPPVRLSSPHSHQ